MKKLEFRFALYVLLAVVFSCNQLNVKADTAPDSKIPGSSEENSLGDDPADYPQINDDHSPGVSDGDNDDDDDDADIGDEGFYDDDDDDEGDGDESLGQSLAKGSTSSVVHKKDDIRQLNVKTPSLQKQQSADDNEISESGSSEDIDVKSNGSDTASDEVSGHGLYARQHVSEKEGSDDEEASAEADEIDNSGNEEDNKNSTDHAVVRSNTMHKPPRNLITKVMKEYRNDEQKVNTSSEEQDTNKESSGQDSGSTPESNRTLNGVGEEYMILKPHPKNATVFGNHTTVKEKEDEKVISPGRKDQEDTGKKIAVSDGKDGNKSSNNSTKSAQRKDTLSPEVHKEKKESNVKTTLIAKQAENAQTTQRHQSPVKKQPIRTAKVSVNRAKTKLHHKYLATHVTHSHMLESHRKVKTASQAAPSTCHSGKILAGHSLKGGARAGHFDVLGETASMHACLQRCCSKKTCDVALLIDGRCYGVACYSDELCEAIPVPHPHFVFSQLGYVNKGQKRGDIERNQEFHCQYGNLTLGNNEQWSGELCGGVVKCKDGITTVKKCPGIPPKPDDCAKPHLFVKHLKGRCCQMKWKCKARHCIFNNRFIKHGYKLSDPLCTGVVSCYNGYLNMEYCPKIPDRPKSCARPKLKTINIPGKCCKKLWVCSDKSCKYDGFKLSHGEKLTDGSCAIVMECRNGFLRNKQCPGPPPVPKSCINPTLKIKRIPGECCEMNWTCELS